MSASKGFFSKMKSAFTKKPKKSFTEELNETEKALDKFEKAHGYYVSPNDSRISSGIEAGRISAMHAAQDRARVEANVAALQTRLNKLKYGAVPKRRVSSRSQYAKKVMKRKLHAKKVTKTTARSQYAVSKSKKIVKRKGVKNYLSQVISNVSDSVKNTGKAVLSPITKRIRKARVKSGPRKA
jgi:hypothetical protein